MKCQKSVNEFRNEWIHEIERIKPMVRLDTQKCQACILHVSRNCRMLKCQYNGECGDASTMENAEMPEAKNAWKTIQYNGEVTQVTPSMLPSLVLWNPNSILKNARKA